MTVPTSRPLIAAAITFGSVACAMLLRSVIDEYLHEPVNYGTFYLAVIVTALHCGFRWALASVLISAATATLVLPPMGRPLVRDWSDVIGLALYLVVSGIIVWLCDRVRRHRRVAEAAAQERQELLVRERAARKEAERLNHAKDGLLAAVSHELRTPLQSILGWAQMLRDYQMSEEEVALAIDSIERGVRIQSQLINDLLDMSRIVMGKLRVDVRPTALSDAMQAAVQTVLPAAKAKGVPIEWQCTAMGAVLGDPDRLQQVAWNLLSNAIKFTPAGGSVRAAVSQDREFVRLTVTDSGEGIAPEFLPCVFNRFAQAEGERRREGLGLGLAIVKEVVELHGGTVQARSEGKGRGAEFQVTLPKHRPSAVAIETATNPLDGGKNQAGALAGKQVLVIDDDADAREVLKLVLCHYGADVITAESADKAIALMALHRPDVVTCDLDMPGSSGFEFIRELRSGKRVTGACIPVVAVTACGNDGLALEKCFEGHLVKPVEAWQLAKELAEVTSAPRRPH
jgi:signal transduction histidine kinase